MPLRRGDRSAQDAAEGLPQTAGAEQGLPDPSEGMADSGGPARGGSAESGLNDPWNDPRIKADMAANRGVAAAAAAASAGQRVSAAPLAETAPRRGDRSAQDAAEGLPQTAGAEQGLPDPSEGVADSGGAARADIEQDQQQIREGFMQPSAPPPPQETEEEEAAAEGAERADSQAAETEAVSVTGAARPFSISGQALRRGVGALAVLAVLAAGLWALFRPAPDPSVSVESPSAPPLDSTLGGAEQQLSPEYQEILADANVLCAEDAVATGGSCIPSVEALPETVELPDFPDPAPQPLSAEPSEAAAEPPPAAAGWSVEGTAPPPLTEGWAPPGYAPPPPAADTALGNPMLDHLTALAKNPPPRMAGEWWLQPDAAAARATAVARAPLSAVTQGFPAPAAQVSGGADPAAGGGSEELLRRTGLRPGDMLQAEMTAALDSDLPGPAIAEVVAGPLAGSRFLGAFRVNHAYGGLEIMFTRLSLKDGETLPAQALGLSPRTGRAVTRSRYDPRYLERFGPAFAAGLLGGYAAARAAVPEVTSVTAGQVVVERRTATERQAVAQGIQAALGPVQEEILAYAPAGPSITLEAGAPLVILITGPSGTGQESQTQTGSIPLPPAAQLAAPALVTLNAGAARQ